MSHDYRENPIIFMLVFALSSTHKSCAHGQRKLSPCCYCQDPPQECRGQASSGGSSLARGTCRCGSPSGSPRPASGQQPCLVLGCVELCLEEGGCVRETCLGVCVTEKDILVCLHVRCVCVCARTCTVGLLQCAYLCVLGGKGRGDCAEFKENQFNSGLF